MKYKLVVFDLDGTILNTLDDLADSCNHVLEEFNFPVHSTEKIKYFVGNGVPKLIERAVPDGLKNPDYEKVLSRFIEYYEKNSSIKTRPYDGIIDLLNQLKQNNVLLAVNTNKIEEAAVILCNKYFPGIFSFISGGKKENRPKPAVDGFNEIFGRTNGISLNECVHIGDSDVDIHTGKNAGIDVIGVSWGFRGKEFLLANGAEKVADDTKELLTLLSS